MSSLLFDLVNEYIDFKVEGKIVQIPYCIVKQSWEKKHPYDMGRTTKDVNYAGKGTPPQIKECLYKTAKQKQFDLRHATSNQITDFMVKQGIGIDCSGYVYNILDKYLQKTKRVSLARYLLRYPGMVGRIERLLFSKNRVRLINGTALTSDLNTIKINKISEIKPGDLLRLTPHDWPGKHPAIIIDINRQYLTYTHSSEYSKIQGPHFAKIKIIDSNKGLESQQWLETTYYGENYGKILFDPQRGDSARRLKCLVG
jgi:hypothetical protein